MSRQSDIEELQQGLTALSRRSRELIAATNPRVSLIAFALLAHIQSQAEPRGCDIAAHFGLDKSTVSRRLDQLVAEGLVERCGERPGRRGQILALTASGREQLARAESAAGQSLDDLLSAWRDSDVGTLARLVSRFNRGN